MTTSVTADTSTQERVFAFLTDSVAHPHVDRIDTHAASVFLEGDRALKIKRAVRFPYLDYSTLKKRKAACDAEMTINRQFAPQIYRRVVPITQNDDGSLRIDGNGAPVEFAIEMTRFDERQTIDHLAESGELDRALVDAIADAIAASHAVAPLAPLEPWIKSIPAFIEGNTTAFRTAACFPANEIDDLQSASQSTFSRIRKLLEQPGKTGICAAIQLQQVMINLVMNGIQAMQSVTDWPRELVIRSRQDEAGQAFISVADCGLGISTENADRLFNAFFTTKSGGMGMAKKMPPSAGFWDSQP